MEKRDKKIIKRYYVVALFIISVSFIPVFAIGFFDHPCADDFSYSRRVYEAVTSGAGCFIILKTAFLTAIEYMNTWQGLYSSSFLLALQPAIFGESWYALTVLIITGMMFIGVTCLTNSFIKDLVKADTSVGYFISVFLSFFLIQGMSIPVEGLYWYNGAVNYMFFWGLLLVQISLLIKYWNRDRAYGIFFLSCTIGFIISGGNHITAFLNLLIGLGFVIYSWVRKKRYLVFIPWICSGIGFFINISSLGTKIRRAKDGQDVSVIKAMIRSGYETLMCNNSCFRVSFLLLLCLLTPILIYIYKESKKKILFDLRILLGILLADFVMISAMYCVPYYAMGCFGEGRVQNCIFSTYYVLGVITWAYGIGFLYNKGKLKIVENLLYKSKIISTRILMLCMICYIAFSGSGVNRYSTGVKALQELVNGSTISYHKEYMQRAKMYKDSKQESVVVNEFTRKPELLFFDDIEENPENWKNKSVANYYKKKSVRLKGISKEKVE